MAVIDIRMKGIQFIQSKHIYV